MKKFLALNLAILPLSLFAFEVNFSKSFSKTVNPDILTTNITISVQKSDETAVNEEIEKFNNYIKKSDLIKINSNSYSLTPNYVYENNRQKFIGYFGNLYTSIEAKEAASINKFVSKILEIKNSINSNEVKLNISGISWQISEQLKNKSYDELRFEAINWGNIYSDNLSNSLKKVCDLKSVNVSSDGGMIFARNTAPLMAAYDAKVIPDIVPSNNEQNITINSNFVLECK